MRKNRLSIESECAISGAAQRGCPAPAIFQTIADENLRHKPLTRRTIDALGALMFASAHGAASKPRNTAASSRTSGFGWSATHHST